jgi:hypothetical protein
MALVRRMSPGLTTAAAAIAAAIMTGADIGFRVH